MVLRARNRNQIAVLVDPQRPDAWRQEPYYAQLKAWARWAVASRNKVIVVVRVGPRTYVVFPDRDVDLGVVSEGDKIVTHERVTPLGVQWDASTSHQDAPPTSNVGLAQWGTPILKPATGKVEGPKIEGAVEELPVPRRTQ